LAALTMAEIAGPQSAWESSYQCMLGLGSALSMAAVERYHADAALGRIQDSYGEAWNFS
jgi:hypothetical protein